MIETGRIEVARRQKAIGQRIAERSVRHLHIHIWASYDDPP